MEREQAVHEWEQSLKENLIRMIYNLYKYFYFIVLWTILKIFIYISKKKKIFFHGGG